MRTKTGVSRMRDEGEQVGQEEDLGPARPAGRRPGGPVHLVHVVASLGQVLDDVDDPDGLLAGDGPLGLELPLGGQGHDLVGEGLDDR